MSHLLEIEVHKHDHINGVGIVVVIGVAASVEPELDQAPVQRGHVYCSRTHALSLAACFTRTWGCQTIPPGTHVVKNPTILSVTGDLPWSTGYWGKYLISLSTRVVISPIFPGLESENVCSHVHVARCIYMPKGAFCMPHIQEPNVMMYTHKQYKSCVQSCVER